jgi:Flp pilus assembly protein TadG
MVLVPSSGAHGAIASARSVVVASERRTALVRCGDDQGIATVWMVVLVPVMLLAIGLVLDGGIAARDWNTAHNQAAAAARTGAQQINLDLYRRTSRIQLDPAAARRAATAYLAAAGLTGTVTATPGEVTVTVTHITRTQLLALIGVRTLTEHADATATPLSGVTGPLP